jgi:hypothetical protein
MQYHSGDEYGIRRRRWVATGSDGSEWRRGYQVAIRHEHDESSQPECRVGDGGGCECKWTGTTRFVELDASDDGE